MNTKTKTIILLIGIFISGILLGSAGTLVAERAIIKRTLENPEKARHLLVKRINRQLNLDAQQTEEVKQILDEQAKSFAEIRMSVAGDVETTFSETYEKILPLLDESQKEKFTFMYDKMLVRFRKTYYSGIPQAMMPSVSN